MAKSALKITTPLPSEDAQIIPFVGREKTSPTSKHALFSDIIATKESLGLILEQGRKFDNGSAITELDTFNLQGLSSEELGDIVEKKLGVNLSTTEGIEKVNQLLEETKKFYTTTLLRNIPKEIDDIRFRNKGDITSFLAKTQGKNSFRPIYCNILKTALVVNDIVNNPQLIKLDEIGERMIEKYLIKPISVENTFLDTEEYTNGCAYIELDNGEKKTVSFSLGFRGKSKESSTIKSIHTPEVDKNTIVRDAIGLEFTLTEKEDIFLMMYFVYKHLFNEDIRNIRQKNLFSSTDIQNFLREYTGKVKPEFLEEIARAKNEVKNKGNLDYIDIKIIGDVNVPVSDGHNALEQSYPVEVKFVLVNNRNETGYSDHRIMDGMKKILANIRLEGFVSSKYIERVVEQIFRDSPDLGKVFVKQSVTNYYLSKLYRLIVKGGIKDKLYTSPSRWEALTQMDNYPESITGARKSDGTILSLSKK